jgi:hypothetical protein
VSGREEQGAFRRLVRQSGSWSLLVRVLVLTLVVLAAYPALALLVAAQRDANVWFAAALAAAICWLGATLAMLCTAWLRGPQGALYAMLFGMFFRMGLPLGAGLLLSFGSAELKAAGFIGLVLGFYLVTLAAETLLVLPLVQDKQAAKVV